MASVAVYYRHERRTLDVDVRASLESLHSSIAGIFPGHVLGSRVCYARPTGEHGLLKRPADLTPGSSLAVVDDEFSVWRALAGGLGQGEGEGGQTALEPWLVEAGAEVAGSACSRVFLGDEASAQPMRTHGGALICAVCANTCVTPGDSPVSVGHGRAVCACASRSGGECLFAERYGAERGPAGAAPAGSPLAAAVRHVLLSSARAQASPSAAGIQAAAQAAAAALAPGDVDGVNKLRRFVARVAGSGDHMRQYQRTSFVDKALGTMPVAALFAKAHESFVVDCPAWPAHDGGVPPSAISTAQAARWRECLLRAATLWFKSWFTWVNSPPCAGCGGGTSGVGGAPPTPQEAMVGGAGHVELYRCNAPSCAGAVTRFPRLNNPSALLDTKRGRCGEWANAFTGCLLALGFDARKVDDWTDHVWTEVYLPSTGAWVHVDSCEAAVDAPLLYEAGWGKALNYAIASGLDHVVDVTRRYTHKWGEVRGRRGEMGEDHLAALVHAVDARQRATAAPKPGGAGGDALHGAPAPDARVAALTVALSSEQRELEANVAWVPVMAGTGMPGEGEGGGGGTAAGAGAGHLQGRISGALEWRAARGELGGGVGLPSTLSPHPPPSAWLSHAPPDVVCGGWQAVHAGGAEGEAFLPRHLLAHAASPAAVSCSNAAAPELPSPVAATPHASCVTGWGDHAVAVQASGCRLGSCLAWTALPGSGRAPSSWTALAVGVDTRGGPPLPWPPVREVLVALAADPHAVMLYALTLPQGCSTGEHTVWRLLPAVDSTTGSSVDDASSAAWSAEAVGSLSLPGQSELRRALTSPHPIPMAVVGDNKLMYVAGGRLWAVLLPPTDAAAPSLTSLRSAVVAPTPRMTALTCTRSGLLLAWQGASEEGGSTPVAGALVVLADVGAAGASSPSAAPPASLTGVMSPPPPHHPHTGVVHPVRPAGGAGVWAGG